MKSNFNLPKISTAHSANPSLTEKDCCLFPREQHPDTRSDKEYIDMINKRFAMKTTYVAATPKKTGLQPDGKPYAWIPAKRGRPRTAAIWKQPKTNFSLEVGNTPKSKMIVEHLNSREMTLFELMNVTKIKRDNLYSTLRYYVKIGVVDRVYNDGQYYFRVNEKINQSLRTIIHPSAK